jgi:type I restriction enzyme, S subunit
VTLNKVKLGAVAKVLNGYAFKSEEYVESGIRIIRITNVQKGRIQDDNPKFIDICRSGEFSRFMLTEGDILASLTGNVGRVGIIEKSMLPAALNQRVGALKIDSENVEPEYLFHVLNSENFEKDAIMNSKGIAQLNLSSKWIENYEIPLPSLPEQRRIAKILDAADALRAKRRESIAQLDALIQSTFLDMFGDPVTNPKGWEARELSNLGKIVTGKTPPTRHEGMFGGDIPFATPSDFDNYLASTARTITTEGAKFTKIVRAGSALVGCIGNIGKMAKTPVRTAFNQQINAIEWLEVVADGFGIHALKYCVPQMLEKSSSTTVPIINKSGFSSIRMIVPPLPLQHHFASIVESIERQKARLRAHLAELDTLFASLQHRAFNGEL